MRKQRNPNSEQGIALMVALFALILVSAVGLALMFSMNGETAIDAGFRQSNLAYFASRSGLEETRDRIRKNGGGNGLQQLLPTVPIGQANGVVYVINANNEVVQPWSPNVNGAANPYFDDELCHEVNLPAVIVNSPGQPNVPCPRNVGSVPTLPAWYVQPPPAAEALPGNVALSYKWTRINLKMNETSAPWCVLGANCNHLLPGGPSADQVCFNGKNEFVLSEADTPLEVPGLIERGSMPSQLAMAMAMFEGGSTGHGNSSHASATTTSGSSTSSATGGTSTSGSSSSSTGSGSSTGTSSSSSSSSSSTASSSSSSSSSTTGIVGTGSSSTGIAGTGSSSTGIAGTGSSSTGIAGTGSSSSSSSSSGGGSSSSSSSSSSGGQPAPTCGTAAPPLPGTPIGTGAGPVNAPNCQAVDSQPVYVLTTLAVAPNSVAPNKARRMLQYEVSRLALPPVPSALTLAGPNPNVTNIPDSNNFFINGNDTGSCGPPGPPVPGVGTLTDVGTGGQTAIDVATQARNNFIGAIPAGRMNYYTGADACPANQPDVQNVQNTTNSLYSTTKGLNGIVQDVSNAATQTYSGNITDPPNLGTDASPKVTVIDGDLTLSGNMSGAGILLVTGAITFKGTFTFHGVLLVIGAGVLQANGGGSGDFHGAVVVANIGNNSGCASGKQPCYSTNPTETNLNPTLGSPTLGWNGGGSNGISYDTCYINTGLNTASYTVIARREITY